MNRQIANEINLVTKQGNLQILSNDKCAEKKNERKKEAEEAIGFRRLELHTHENPLAAGHVQVVGPLIQRGHVEANPLKALD